MNVYSASSAIYTVNSPRRQTIENLIDFIHEVNELLQKEVDLSPANPLVTSMINDLSVQLRSSYAPKEVSFVLNNAYIQANQRSLQDKLSEAEFLAELQDCRNICQSEQPLLDTLKMLPTWNIYESLVSQELSVLRQLIQQDGHLERLPIVFVGSGPMPLSAILIHLLSDREVICLELDAVAYAASCELLECLGLTDKVTVVKGNGSEFNYRSCGAIIVASLVQNKMDVLEQIVQTASTTLVAVRTAEGIRQIRYQAINESQLNEQGWRIVGRTSPDENLVINSTLFLERVTNT